MPLLVINLAQVAESLDIHVFVCKKVRLLDKLPVELKAGYCTSRFVSSHTDHCIRRKFALLRTAAFRAQSKLD